MNAAFADPEIRAVLATIEGEDQITVVPHLDAATIVQDPRLFLGYSANTNLLNWLWTNGVAGFYGGATQVHLGPGPHVDPIHALSLRAALLTGERLDLTDPGESEDMGREVGRPAGPQRVRRPRTDRAWTWAGRARYVTGRTCGGCIDVVQWILTAGRIPPDPTVLDGGVLLRESSDDLIPAREFGWITRSLGERGILGAVDVVIFARPPTSDFSLRPSAAERRAKRDAQRDTAIDVVDTYNPETVIVVGPPFGQPRPQWIVPYGGLITVDGASRRLSADYR